MKSEIWIARDKPINGATVGSLLLYGQKPWRDKKNGVFCPKSVIDYDEMMFFECCDPTDMTILNPNAFPEITWENSPQKLMLTKETDWLELADI